VLRDPPRKFDRERESPPQRWCTGGYQLYPFARHEGPLARVFQRDAVARISYESSENSGGTILVYVPCTTSTGV
jgi:hypothetical protein